MSLIIGISGPTCSGKTNLTTRLTRAIPNCISIHQDQYFLPENSEKHVFIPELKHMNWELLTSMDMPKMMEDVNELISKHKDSDKILIIEGHTIFNYQPIANICQLRLYIDLSKEVCFSRRSVRTYEPADVPGYFEKIVWPEHERHAELMRQQVSDITFLDGTLDQETLLSTSQGKILAHVEQRFHIT